MRRIRMLSLLVAVACAALAGSTSAVNAAGGSSALAAAPVVELSGKRWERR